MVKAIFLIRRKPGLSVEEFRTHYEDQHVDIALEYIRPYLKDYHRNYPDNSSSYFDKVENNEGGAAPEFNYDCVTEMWFENEERLQSMLNRLSEPAVRAVIGADEDLFIDPQSVVFLKCTETKTKI